MKFDTWFGGKTMIYYKNAEEKIKEITKSYDFGNICDLENREIEAEESSFDTSSYNFHIISKNENEIATLIKESRKILVDEIKKQGNTIQCKRSIGDIKESNKPAYICSLGNRSSLKIDPLQMECYVAICYKKCLGMICFEQMFVEKDKVWCAPGRIQYYKCPIEDGVIRNINQNKKGEFDCCYPMKNMDKNEQPDGRGVYNSKYTVCDIKGNGQEIVDRIIMELLEILKE